ncbi:YwiB family protein [Lactobacillaceae bacterium Melli_B4]
MHLETKVSQEEDHSDFVYDVDGQLARVGNLFYLRYQEEDPQTGKKVPVTFKFDDNGEVRLTRAAENRLQVRFAQGKKMTARYHTPYGAMKMDAETLMLGYQYQDDPARGQLQVDYRLYSGADLLGDYKIRLQFSA